VARIQDVATRQSLIGHPLGIRDVAVETAGERGAAVVYDLPRCRDYTKRILQAGENRKPGR
jgi:uncharacterized membrane protein YdbT with pleckstrin-like domain